MTAWSRPPGQAGVLFQTKRSLGADIQDVAAAGAKEYFHRLNEARQNVLGHEIKSGSGKSPAMDAAGAAA